MPNTLDFVKVRTKLPGILPILARYVVSFAVMFAIGLSPYLGAERVPGFTALFSLIPSSLTDSVIPVSAFLMGYIAVLVQMNHIRRSPKEWIDRQFNIAAIAVVIAIAGLAIWSQFTVVSIVAKTDTANPVHHILIGIAPPEQSSGQSCQPEFSDEECITGYLTENRGRIEAYWGRFNVRASGLVLELLYWAATGLMVWFIGLLVLRELEAKQETAGAAGR